jgi:hypothetical protein
MPEDASIWPNRRSGLMNAFGMNLSDVAQVW